MISQRWVDRDWLEKRKNTGLEKSGVFTGREEEISDYDFRLHDLRFPIRDTRFKLGIHYVQELPYCPFETNASQARSNIKKTFSKPLSS